MISKYYTQDIILLSSSTGSATSTGGYWSTSTGSEYTSASAIKAAVNLLSGDEILAYGKIGFDARYKAYCDVSTGVYEGRRVRWNGDDYEIVDVPKNTLQKNHHLRFLLRNVGNA